MSDITEQLQEQLSKILSNNELDNGIAISGGHSKDFYGREIIGDEFSIIEHAGIIEYEPRELVVTARTGTSLLELKNTLAENNQMLPFEPPSYSAQATLGGTIACGFSGPRRPYGGSARDLLLGTKILNGKAEVLNFGGQVMKNVAGYDLSRLMVGAMGTLGIILQASMKVLPKPECEMTLIQELPEEDAIQMMNKLASKNLPLSASAFYQGNLYLRFSSVETSVKKIIEHLGGDVLKDANSFWIELNEHRHNFFQIEKSKVLWRLSLPPAAPVLALDGDVFYDWGGAQRWIYSDAKESVIRDVANSVGGHATQFRKGDRQSDIFHPLSSPLMSIHKQLKKTMDPAGIFNSGRLYKQF